MMAAAAETMTFANATNPNLVGQSTFRIVSWLAFLLAGGCALVTADTLSRERREGTLGLLLLTKLKGYDVVLGKLCASGLTASFALFGILPALGLVVLAGGVSRGQFGRTSLALLDAIFLFLVVGMWISSRSENQGEAMRKAVLAVFLLCVVPRIMMYVAGSRWIAALSPLTAFYLSSDPEYALNQGVYWTGLTLTQIEAWALILWTGAYVWQNWQRVEWSAKPPKPEWKPLEEREVQALAATRKTMLNQDPICWAVSRLRIQSALWLGTLLLVLAGTGFSWGALMGQGSATRMGVLSSLHLLVSLASAALLAWAAGRFLYETQRNGELELILTTPIGGKDVVNGNWRALCQPLRAVWLLLVFRILLELTSSGGTGGGGGLMLFQTFTTLVVRVLDIIALFWVGMYFGLKARKAIAIIGWTVGLVVAIPWVLSFMFLVWTSLMMAPPWAASSMVLGVWVLLWPLMMIAKNVLFINWAAGRLRADLRAKAAVMRRGDWMQ